MKCDKIMYKFDSLDNKKYMPLRMKIHFFFCPECRIKAEKMNAMLNSLHGEYLYEMRDSISSHIMQLLIHSGNRYAEKKGYKKWIAAGVVIVAGRFAFSYSESLNQLNSYFGQSLDIPLNIVMGLLITAYSAVFIFSHLDDLKKRTDIR